ncbi:N-acetylglutaminylglutamine amidotransferase [Hydrogenophaga sp.]|jgi:asparagine synthase (glutamine-hydrolysing)|uniref:N-acetylglutaminylglutamine amidotransferase n=1 Tax=Hydrogenophaga sp. TaxID=1904254 RepID=UPI00272EE9EB|nr:N-acetylglutaminylglutamine amidotransferase [Hydrogenophaga sp.]MDP2073546.1 N-acetylglutaminylglutamine amidotransferase [Hydrogenophaga sp.]MDP2251950.1 N-acetylglutaminylglutamine amidotransferase [Hydrogenophaga sp.]MDP3109398.1 N-acetylglutaminylglutamine amidotransferase [Hydrogenophaga sp.]MDP3351329.1 N-acetylglutaminylglutamine amidotransferase [Hydrogenophaga sp.]MDZ4400355.1 N-acetylglutaminylglutamine amidotransferase [Hydrogenophaga sp.]
MCGIAGEIRFDGEPVDVAALSRMNERQQPRGPDGQGLQVSDRFGFGHRRLKIMDLSEAAQQPMFDPALGAGIVFNGAVYNHADLREELEAAGYHFHSTGDTEVLLKAWHAWGPDFVKRLNGMFAFAIWERDSGRVLLGRDRLGIKPLYLAPITGGLRFASSLPALLAAGGIDTAIDPVGLNHYLSLHAIVPPPHTLLRGVRKLAPGTLLQIEADGTSKEHSFWSLSYERDAADEARSFDDWREILLGGLRAAVKRRLVADVPVGALLSGGVDSSLIVGLMAEAGVRDLRTYNVGFEDVGGEKGNEFEYADLVAQRFGTVHERIFVPEAELLNRLPEAIAAMSEPMVSHDCIGFYLLSEAVSRHSKVVQSGQGADEVFGGYHWYPKLQGSTQPVADYLAAFCDRDHAEMRDVVQDRYLTGDVTASFIASRLTAPGASDPVDQALRMDTTVMLVDDPVKRVDNMTMAFGLEARVPFLDHELVELAARIPARHKLAGGGKGILKEAARSVIPSEVIDRPKGYFPVPALKHLRGPVLESVRDALNSQAARERGLFRPTYVQQLLDDPSAHMTPLRGSKLWQLGLLELWLQQHVR